jgi:hypothetical protein
LNGSVYHNGGNTTTPSVSSVTVASNLSKSMLVVIQNMIVNGGSSANFTSATWGTTMTKGPTFVQANGISQMYYLLSPTPGTNNVTFVNTANVTDAVAFVLTGVKQVAPPDGSNSVNTQGGAAHQFTTLTTTKDAAVVIQVGNDSAARSLVSYDGIQQNLFNGIDGVSGDQLNASILSVPTAGPVSVGTTLSGTWGGGILVAFGLDAATFPFSPFPSHYNS